MASVNPNNMIRQENQTNGSRRNITAQVNVTGNKSGARPSTKNSNYNHPPENMGDIVPRFVETAKYGSVRERVQKQAENHIFSQTNSVPYSKNNRLPPATGFSAGYAASLGITSADGHRPAHARNNTAYNTLDAASKAKNYIDRRAKVNRNELLTPQGQIDAATLASSGFHNTRQKHNQTAMPLQD